MNTSFRTSNCYAGSTSNFVFYRLKRNNRSELWKSFSSEIIFKVLFLRASGL